MFAACPDCCAKSRRTSTPALSARLPALLAALLLSTAACAADPEDAKRTISVNGSASIAVKPDHARVRFTIHSQAGTAEEAARANAEAADRVFTALKGALGKQGQLSTASYSLSPRYSWVQKAGERERKQVGFEAHNEITAETSQMDSIGRLIDQAIRAGATGAGSVEFFRKDLAEHQRKALLKAGQAASAEARTVAESLGVKLGPLLQASSSSQMPQPVRQNMVMMRSMEAAADTPIEAGDVTVQASVHAMFAIR